MINHQEQRIIHPWVKLKTAASKEKDPQKRAKLEEQLNRALASHGITSANMGKPAANQRVVFQILKALP